MAVIVREILADTFLGLATAIVLASSVGVLVMRDVYDKLHFVTPAALVAPVLVMSGHGSRPPPPRRFWSCCSW